MFFEYTYRSQTGSIASDVIEAKDRADAFCQLKERGIAAVSVKEAKGPRRSERSAVSLENGGVVRPSLLKGAIAGIAVVLIAILCWCLLSGKVETEKVPGKKEVVKAKQPEKKLTQRQPSQSGEQVVAIKPITGSKVIASVTAAPVTTNETLVATNNVISLPTNELSSVHRNSTEQLLMWVFTTPLGNMPPPLPKLPKCDEKRMWEILSSPIPVKEGDTARQQDAKQMIELAKKELKDYLRKGGDINEFFNYYHGQLKLAHMQFQESQRSIIKVCRDEDPEIARAYIEKVNKDLDEKGIKHVVIPPKFREKLGLD